MHLIDLILSEPTARKIYKSAVLSDPYFSVLSPNTWKYGLEKFRIWTLLTRGLIDDHYNHSRSMFVKAINEFIILKNGKNMLNWPFLMAMVKFLKMYLFILIFFIKQSTTKFKEFKETRDCISQCLFSL